MNFQCKKYASFNASIKPGPPPCISFISSVQIWQQISEFMKKTKDYHDTVRFVYDRRSKHEDNYVQSLSKQFPQCSNFVTIETFDLRILRQFSNKKYTDRLLPTQIYAWRGRTSCMHEGVILTISTNTHSFIMENEYNYVCTF